MPKILVVRQWPAAQQCGNLLDRLRKGALAAFRDEEPINHQHSADAMQLRDIVFRENADLLYAHEETQHAGYMALENLPVFEPLNWSLDFSNGDDFLDFFDFSSVYETPDLGIPDPDSGLDPSAADNMDTMISPNDGRDVTTFNSQALVTRGEVERASANLPVCSPCKKRRIRCDMEIPSCRNCIKLNKECTYWDGVVSQEVSRL